MPLDPILGRLIQKAYRAGFGNIHTFSPEKMRAFLTHPKLKILPANFHDFIPPTEITLRCYTPHNLSSDTILPVVVYVSATAFILDRLTASHDYCSLLANTLQMKIINLGHRLAPEHKFPGFLQDCIDSLLWIEKESEQLRIDPTKIAIWGESSGASIAATCTHWFRDCQHPLIAHQTLFYPMVDLVGEFESKQKYAYGYMLDRTFIDWLDQQGFHPEQNRACPLASPLRSPCFNALPPATIITAEYDPLHDEGVAYAEKLRAAGVPVMHHTFPGTIHGFMRFYPKILASIEALKLACCELSNALRNSHIFRTYSLPT